MKELVEFINCPESLVGTEVLIESGTSYGGTSLKIRKVESVTKTQIKTASGEKYNINNGTKVGMPKGRMAWGQIDHAKFISPEESNILKEKWKNNKKKSALTGKISEKVKTLNLAQLEFIHSYLVKEGVLDDETKN